MVSARKLYSINEIFESIQGEGMYTGTPCVFIRLASCNLNCEWCDTDKSVQFQLTPKYIANRVYENPKPLIVITGGEPTVQDLKPLCLALKARGRRNGHRSKVAVETNGTNIETLHNLRKQYLIDWITVSPKSQALSEDVLNRLGYADEVKVVYDEKIDIKKIEFYLSQQLPFGRAFIQPCSNKIGPALQFVMANPAWNLSVQVHKLIGVK